MKIKVNRDSEQLHIYELKPGEYFEWSEAIYFYMGNVMRLDKTEVINAFCFSTKEFVNFSSDTCVNKIEEDRIEMTVYL